MPTIRRAVDIKPEAFPDLNWDRAQLEGSLDKLSEYVRQKALAAIDWYLKMRHRKRYLAICTRATTVFAIGLAGIVPLAPDAWGISPHWSTVLLAFSGVLLALDHHFGFTSGWTRYMLTQQRLQRLLEEFHLRWEEQMICDDTGTADTDLVCALLRMARVYVLAMADAVEQEMAAWANEFQGAARQLDRECGRVAHS